MPTCHFWNSWCLVRACFLGLLHSSSSSSVLRSHLLPSALFTNPPWWLTSVKLRMQSRCSVVYKTFLTNQDRPYTSVTEIAWNMQMSTNDNSINGPQSILLTTNAVISILSATATGCLKKKSSSICFPAENIFSAIFDFHFHENPRFRNEFQALRNTHISPSQS